MLLLRNNRRPQADFPKCAPAALDNFPPSQSAMRRQRDCARREMQKLAAGKFPDHSPQQNASRLFTDERDAPVEWLRPARSGAAFH
jgi:hypothetical protein